MITSTIRTSFQLDASLQSFLEELLTTGLVYQVRDFVLELIPPSTIAPDQSTGWHALGHES